MPQKTTQMSDPEAPPVLVCLHWLGGSRRSWDALAARLAPKVRVLALDLPGFGDAADQPGASVAAMAEHVAGLIRAEAPARWMLAGHSMGAKVALAVAKMAEAGAPELSGLSHLVLLAGSPPAPEPMEDARRAEMLTWFAGDAEQSRTEAQTLIDGSVGAPLDAEPNGHAAAEILRLSRDAWTAWLESGSREDWVERIGTLRTPALVIAGDKDADLGPDGQQRLMVRHFADVTLEVLPGVGHLLPIEAPDAVAGLIATHVLGRGTAIPPDYRRFIASDRVSARTRGLLLDRAKPVDPNRSPKAMTPAQMAVLRAVVDRVLPQPAPRIDIAAEIDEGLATEPGDGWRFADLPSDQNSYRHGLDTLAERARATFASSFEALDAERQDDLLSALVDGKASTEPAPGPDRLSPHQMALWFEDLRANVVRVYMSHPLAMARYGYSGIGYGGDGPRLQGFHTLGLGKVEPWEPHAMDTDR
ncbi:alpha/beta hydrolase [Lichenihabitans sp. Uapishka_5]|uniref:alpha/beta hydrolase n=1 Tax=Lichenihabitans sp. Uapishka_5 TaxID=3037302 RepID=UPI0029E8155B|nr:alpha/beta hydrolase [Lichenihabitans sp. Uapishka_5]MDX7950987.1 alpha/beta hydrolase [Lichenihabitans sp. Uapishka_5]